MRRHSKKKKIKNRNKTGIFAIISVVLMLCVAMSFQIYKLKARNLELSEKKAQLEKELDDQEQRTDDLEEEKVYAQTSKYIEEIAKSIGYTYPNEIIFKPSND